LHACQSYMHYFLLLVRRPQKPSVYGLTVTHVLLYVVLRLPLLLSAYVFHFYKKQHFKTQEIHGMTYYFT